MYINIDLIQLIYNRVNLRYKNIWVFENFKKKLNATKLYLQNPFFYDGFLSISDNDAALLISEQRMQFPVLCA